MKIEWSTQARRDLKAIHDFIGRDSERLRSCRLND